MTVGLRAPDATSGALQVNGVDRLVMASDGTLSGSTSPAIGDNSTKLATTEFVKDQPGRLLRTTVFTKDAAGTQYVSVDGAAPTTVGAATFTKLAETNMLIVDCDAGGGGSGGNPTTTAGQHVYSNPGGGGASGRGRYTGAISPIAVTVGSAGAAGGLNGAGGTGGSTTFGGLMTCLGGAGSPAGIANSGVSNGGVTAGGATPTGANLLAWGGGQSGQIVSSALGFIGGNTGGCSGRGVSNGYGAGAPGKFNGAGTASPQAGIAGYAGCVVVQEFT